MQDKTNNVIDLYKDIMRSVEELSTCPYTPDAFREILGKIPAAVRICHESNCLQVFLNISAQIDRLNLEVYAILDYWVAELGQRIEGILLQRVTTVIQQ